jgi:hypothetical protein
MAAKRIYKLKPGIQPFMLYGTEFIINDHFLSTHGDLGKLYHRFGQFRQRVAIEMVKESKPKKQAKATKVDTTDTVDIKVQVVDTTATVKDSSKD